MPCHTRSISRSNNVVDDWQGGRSHECQGVQVGFSGRVHGGVFVTSPSHMQPIHFFKLLYDPSLAAGFMRTFADSPCKLHPAVRSMVSHYGKDLGNFDSRADIYVLMLLSRTDTSNLESLMGLIRRILKSRQQTHALSIGDTNASWCLHRQRTKVPDTCMVVAPSSKQEQPVEDGPPAKRQKKSTNSWNLFCRQGTP
jgi:hypothetical protein